MTSKLSRNLSFSSRCHWNVRFAGATISVRRTSPRSLQFLEQQPRHDRLARAGVVGQEEADARQLEEVVVDGLELVRQRIDPGDREREVGVVLVGEPEPLGLDAEPEENGVAVVCPSAGVTLISASRSLLSKSWWYRPGADAPTTHPEPVAYFFS